MEPALNNSSNYDFAFLINRMSFSKIDELFKTLRLKDLKTDNITYEIPKDEPYKIGRNPNFKCPLVKDTEDFSHEHCEIVYCYEDLRFVLKDSNSKHGTLVYLKNKEIPLENKMEFKNDEGMCFYVREFNNEKKILTINRGAKVQEIVLSGPKMEIGKPNCKMYLNNSGKPVLLNTDNDGFWRILRNEKLLIENELVIRLGKTQKFFCQIVSE